MDIKTFYATIGGNYEEMLERCKSDERIIRYVSLFPSDDNFALLKSSLAENNAETAFRAAHTLKGLVQNLSFTALFHKVEPLMNILRSGSLDVGTLPDEVEELYNLTIKSLAQLNK